MVSLKPEEISKLIKEQIRRYDDELEVGETGTVITIGDGISLVHGLNVWRTVTVPTRCVWNGIEP